MGNVRIFYRSVEAATSARTQVSASMSKFGARASASASFESTLSTNSDYQRTEASYRHALSPYFAISLALNPYEAYIFLRYRSCAIVMAYLFELSYNSSMKTLFLIIKIIKNRRENGRQRMKPSQSDSQDGPVAKKRTF